MLGIASRLLFTLDRVLDLEERESSGERTSASRGRDSEERTAVSSRKRTSASRVQDSEERTSASSGERTSASSGERTAVSGFRGADGGVRVQDSESSPGERTSGVAGTGFRGAGVGIFRRAELDPSWSVRRKESWGADALAPIHGVFGGSLWPDSSVRNRVPITFCWNNANTHHENTRAGRFNKEALFRIQKNTLDLEEHGDHPGNTRTGARAGQADGTRT